MGKPLVGSDTEQAFGKAHSGQKLDEFGSETEASQTSVKKLRKTGSTACRAFGLNRLPIEIYAAERARWLAELAEALEQAETLVSSLGSLLSQPSPDFTALYGSLDAARAEVRALRSRRAATLEMSFDPLWMRPTRQ